MHPDDGTSSSTLTTAARQGADESNRLVGQNHVLSKIVRGCSIPELLSSVLDYAERFATGWHCCIHIVDTAGEHLESGNSKSLGRSLLGDLETLPLSEHWPLGAAFVEKSCISSEHTSRRWNEAYRELEKEHGVHCEWAAPAIAPDGSTVAIISLFCRDGEVPTRSPETVLEVASTLLGMGIEKRRTVERLLSRLRETERRLQDCEKRYAAVANGARDGLWDWDLTLDEMHLSPRTCSLLGLEAEARCAPSEEWWQRVHPDDRERVRKELDAHLGGRRAVFESEHRMLHAEGHHLWVLSRGEAVRDERGEATRLAGSLTDITTQKLAEERLRRDALHDDLTGLPNRTMFMEHLGRTLSRAQRSRSPFEFAVLFLDFDRFKRINDSLGHLVGDQLLMAFAERLSTCVRPADTVSRLGGDEFSVILEPVRGVADATRVAERIHQSLRQPFRVSGLEVFITVSIGIAIGSQTYDRPEDVLRDADTAMYRAKTAGSRHAVFDEAMHARAIEQLKLESELRLALTRREFCLLYQPVVSLENGSLDGIEALARWKHPTRGLLPPSAFLGVAEESGIIVDIGWWVFRTACLQMKEWQERLPKAASLSVHVNLSDKQLFQPELPERIESILSETGFDPERLVLDIPENVIMHRAESSVTILGQLKSLRLRIHLDDFGTGYSSLGYLHRFQIETLKIDRSFVRHLRSGGDNWRTVRAIVSLAANLGMDVIAEGVESEEQLRELEKLRCRGAQGSFFHEPLTEQEIERLLDS